MISPSAERAENTMLSAANMKTTISQPRGLARTIDLKDEESEDIDYRVARAPDKYT
tara:strand:- start:2243 stop:2410 length:168 start_codon:yes stop_codon:yes gene_type:complete